MANINVWNGSSTFSAGQTPFGFYDNDTQFAAEADKVALFCATRLGYPVMDVELSSGSLYACFEEATTVYGNEVYNFKIREHFINVEGTSNATSLNNSVVAGSLQRVIELSQDYGTEAEVGGKVTKEQAMLDVTASVQDYDLNQWAIDKGITGGIEVRRIFYEAPPAILRYFDPYAGTGTGIQSLMDAFDFGSYSPGINFLMMPASFDLLKVQAIEFNDQIRRSAYSFELVNNQLKIFPVPKERTSVRFEYYKIDDKLSSTTDSSGSGIVTNVSNVPYNNPVYTELNSVARQWIFSYTLALARELLGYIRGKYSTVPVPGSEATLNANDLLTDARSEKATLIEALRGQLLETTRRAQLEKQAAEGESMNKILNDVPYKIYIG
jgi:hypothetical protein